MSQPEHYAEVRGNSTAFERPKDPDRYQDITISRGKARFIEPSVAITSSDQLGSSSYTQRSLWPVRGANNEVTYISISTETALKPDFWPASSLCGSFFPPPSGGSSNDHLPFTKAELESSLPQALLSDWQVYQILQLGLGRIMSKNHPSDLRQGVGCIRIKRPNRGRAAKILSNGVWVYGSWRSRQGRTYQLFGNEGVAARLSNNIRGELRCVIQNDNPEPEDVQSHEPRPASTGTLQRYMNEIPYENVENQNSPISSLVYPRSFPTQLDPSTECGPGLVHVPNSFTSSPYANHASSPFTDSTSLPLMDFTNSPFGSSTDSSITSPTSFPPSYPDPAYASFPAQYDQSSGHRTMGVPQQHEGAYRDHLSQLEMMYPSSEIWQPLARGERRRRTAITPLDYAMQNPSIVAVPETTEHSGWPQTPWISNIDDSQINFWAGVPAVDYGFLPEAFNLTDASVAYFDGKEIYDVPDLEGGDVSVEYQGTGTFDAPPNVENCVCEKCQSIAAAETTVSNPEY